jgi:hypothetical protein
MIAVDPNVLVGAIQTFDPQLRATARHAVKSLFLRGEELLCFPQNLVEFWNASTRPANANGLGLFPEQAAGYVDRGQSQGLRHSGSRRAHHCRDDRSPSEQDIELRPRRLYALQEHRRRSSQGGEIESQTALCYCFAPSFWGWNSVARRWPSAIWPALSFLASNSRCVMHPELPLAAQIFSHL